MTKLPFTPYVQFKPKGDQIQIIYGYAMYNKANEDGTISSYVPGFDIYFSAPSLEEAKRRVSVLVKAFFAHNLDHTKKKFKALVLELHKLGFKAPQDALIIKNILNNKGIGTTKFRSENDIIPEGFTQADGPVEAELEVSEA